jgi:hypothetical protein
VDVRFKPDAIVDGIAQSLFAAQIPFRCLYADVPEQELYLLEFSSCLVAKSRACSPEMPHAAFCRAFLGRRRGDGVLYCTKMRNAAAAS